MTFVWFFGLINQVKFQGLVQFSGVNLGQNQFKKSYSEGFSQFSHFTLKM